MTNENAETAAPKPAFPVLASLIFPCIAASVAAATAFVSLKFGFAPWAMFVGWVAYFTRPTSAAQGFRTALCVWLGLAAGACASLALGALGPILGQAAILPVVFVVACIVLALRGVRPLDNVLAWFLGLIAFFASHLQPSLLSVGELAVVTGMGVAAGWVAQRLQQRFAMRN